jgi:hypothetical protein
MSDETLVNATATKDGAKQMHFAGQRLASQWAQLKTTIESLNGQKPWGDDEPGNQFNKDYLNGEHYATSTLEATAELVELMKDLGGQVAMSVDGSLEVDDLVASWFGGGDK